MFTNLCLTAELAVAAAAAADEEDEEEEDFMTGMISNVLLCAKAVMRIFGSTNTGSSLLELLLLLGAASGAGGVASDIGTEAGPEELEAGAEGGVVAEGEGFTSLIWKRGE